MTRPGSLLLAALLPSLGHSLTAAAFGRSSDDFVLAAAPAPAPAVAALDDSAPPPSGLEVGVAGAPAPAPALDEKGTAAKPKAKKAGLGVVQKVIDLIAEMKTQVEAEAEADLTAFDKSQCWCQTNKAEKEQAIKAASLTISTKEAFIKESTASSASLKEAVAGLEEDMAADEDALATASSLREKEKSEFEAQSEDLSESIRLLKEAVSSLSKVQLVQTSASPSGSRVPDGTALVQVLHKVARAKPEYKSILTRDFFDMMGALEAFPGSTPSLGAAFLHQKSEGPKGAAAGAKSYNSQSGGVLGILQQMLDTMTSDLADAEKAEKLAVESFAKLKESKTGEITAAQNSRAQKSAEVAELNAATETAKEDLASTTAAKAADEDFLAKVEAQCTEEATNYKARSLTRGEELRALAETLKILTAEDSRDLFASTMGAPTLIQLAAKSTQAQKASQRLAQVGRRHENLQLVSLASRVGIDSFSNAKKALDTMAAELKKQQQAEYEKNEFCKASIDKVEDQIKAGQINKEDLEIQQTQLTNAVDVLTAEIAELKKEESSMQVTLKEAGEQRKQENQLFQNSVMDQRATVNILRKAMARLQSFYGLAQTKKQAPSVPAPPGYEPSAGASGVLAVLEKVISDAQVEAEELNVSEQTSQKSYETMLASATSTIEALRSSQSEKEQQLASAKADKASAQEGLTAVGSQLEKLTQLLQAHHLECDFLLKYFSVRQEARSDELDAISDAKAILSGAKFE
mmetsp:Transcript_49268/g.104837  ORF Transcript_49268/g.104837 Transcript_49268/m.104837 type:complete len:748 (-) Transcript_49268:69-2312(-)|eukprot:CAMPEP_0206467996 /NCGR_PEP_ID=MMETSP0324_2-20121206/29360_1 /ASSEMBLY_ACC=CAM_ASM_000836 /TAXON_ID=2866 /ORGANISM="Crypthecodinium cohnii, Strain Seligo" /LENGTH=747 /DNA_ID=CAMNT_0053941357 /DNA_START=147 /DNA_END=2390 /DNA_ORIENTATION=+